MEGHGGAGSVREKNWLRQQLNYIVAYSGLDFIKDLGRRLTLIATDQKEICYLFQRIAVTIQCFKAIVFRGLFAHNAQPDLSE